MRGGVAAYELIVDAPAGGGDGGPYRLLAALPQQLHGDAAVAAELPLGADHDDDPRGAVGPHRAKLRTRQVDRRGWFARLPIRAGHTNSFDDAVGRTAEVPLLSGEPWTSPTVTRTGAALPSAYAANRAHDAITASDAG
jgi:hypothetical protein